MATDDRLDEDCTLKRDSSQQLSRATTPSVQPSPHMAVRLDIERSFRLSKELPHVASKAASDIGLLTTIRPDSAVGKSHVAYPVINAKGILHSASRSATV